MYKKSKVLREIRKSLEAGNLLGRAWRSAGLKSPDTLAQWRKRGMIDRYIKNLMYDSQEKRIDMVEDGHFKKLAEGKGSARDYEFYLTRRCPERWPAKQPSNNVVTVVQENRYKDFSDKELDVILEGFYKRKQREVERPSNNKEESNG